MSTRRLVKQFQELIAIDSVSRNEAAIHAYLKEKFSTLGLTVKEDNSMAQTKLGANNLIATLKGDSTKTPLLFSAHTDTVTPGNGIEMIEQNGVLYSKGETILAADDKAGIAIMLEVIQQLQEQAIPTGDIEFVLSPGEEIGLIGAAALDMSQLQAQMGYVLDSGGAVGKVTIASPTLYMYEVTIAGKSAHAGLEPEKGVSAVAILADALKEIEMGRIDERTTANIGVIQGGEATNIVMDSLLVKGEVRAIDPDKAASLIKAMQQAFETAAAAHGGTVNIEVKKMATGFDIQDEEPVMQLLLAAGEQLDYEIIREVSGGGSDANVFNAKGKSVVNLSIGYENVHTTQESIPIVEMEKAVQLVMELIKLTPRKNEVLE